MSQFLLNNETVTLERLVKICPPEECLHQNYRLLKCWEDLHPSLQRLSGLEPAVRKLRGIGKGLDSQVHLHHCLLGVDPFAIHSKLGLFVGPQLEINAGISTLP